MSRKYFTVVLQSFKLKSLSKCLVTFTVLDMACVNVWSETQSHYTELHGSIIDNGQLLQGAYAKGFLTDGQLSPLLMQLWITTGFRYRTACHKTCSCDAHLNQHERTNAMNYSCICTYRYVYQPKHVQHRDTTVVEGNLCLPYLLPQTLWQLCETLLKRHLAHWKGQLFQLKPLKYSFSD